MPQWLYDALSGFQSFMGRGSVADVALMVVLSGAGSVLLVTAHEAGHAIAAKARGLRVTAISVGDRPILTLPFGALRVDLGWASGAGDVGGYVRLDLGRATPTDTLVVALAGPAASFASAVALACIAVGLADHGMVAVVAALLALQGILMAVGNLVPRGTQPGRWSDGQWARVSVRARRDGVRRWVRPPDPHATTSTAPPQRPG